MHVQTRAKWRQVASLAAGQTYVKQFVSNIQHQGPRDPVQLLRLSIVLTGPLFDIHKARGPFLMTQPRAKGQRLASPYEPNRLNTNTRIVPSSLCVEEKPVVKPCSYKPPPIYVLSRPRVSLTPHSTVPPYTDLVHVLSRSLASDSACALPMSQL